ncbi:hypothetical protein HMPREF1989_00025 [Porphyromonas gingivalis F0566]|nr:hypothetical protein HMPREF1989_00025 [Porphyromonas gingivalis F0566]
MDPVGFFDSIFVFSINIHAIKTSIMGRFENFTFGALGVMGVSKAYT